MKAARTRRDDFDAALVPGFREATRANYAALGVAWQDTASGALDAQGRLRPGVFLERDCPACGAASTTARPLFEKFGLHHVECAGCGLTYTREVLDEEHDRQLYVQSPAQSGYQDLKRNAAYAALEQGKSRYIVERIGDYRSPPGTLLDIGPGSGKLLAAAAQAGWTARGIEANAPFAQAAQAAGLDVVHGFFPDALPAGERFEAIALLDVIEHLHRPLEQLRSVADRVAPGGVVAIQVPNVESLLVQLEGARNSNFCHGHWNHFSPRTLAALGVAAGLEPLATETIVSELDRILAFPATEVAAVAMRLRGEAPPADVDPEWLHARGLGYKVLAFFGKPHG